MKRRKHMFWGIYMHFDHESVIKDNCISPRMLKKVIFIKNGWLFENKLILHNNKKNSRKTTFNILITKKWAMLQPWGKRWIVENYLRSPKRIFKKIFELYCVKARIFITFESIGITVRRRRHPAILSLLATLHRRRKDRPRIPAPKLQLRAGKFVGHGRLVQHLSLSCRTYRL